MNDLGLRTDAAKHIALYIQLASIFRHRILSDAWRPGYRLPNLETLAAEFRVARVTVRQAVALLVRENLLTSSRGRGTFVRPLDERGVPASPAIDPMGSPVPGQTIVVHSIAQVSTLPDALRGRFAAFDNYTEIRKVHLHGGRPFGAMQIFVPTALYRRFPKRRIERERILRLVLRETEVAEAIEQVITVEPADYFLSERLNYPFGSPVARIVRRIVDPQGRIVYTGSSWYRGDQFVINLALPTSILRERSPDELAPSLRRP